MRAARGARSLLLCGALLAAGTAHAVQVCELDGEHVNPANGHSTAGKNGLMRCRDRDSGELRREQQLQDGAFVGLVRLYEKGKLAGEHSVNAQGNRHGRARSFDAAGQVIREAVYENGREVGLVRSFHPDGRLRRVAFHAQPGGERASAEFNARGQLSALRCADRAVLAPAVDDARLCGHGGGPSQVELHDANGVLRSRLSYRAGQRVRSEAFHANGRPAVQEETDGDRRIERRLSPEGVTQHELVSLIVERRTIRQRELEYSERGMLVREQRWTPAGEPESEARYYLNGQPRSKAVHRSEGDVRVIDVEEFHDNGQRAAQGRYALAGNGRRIPIGTHRRFGTEGRLTAEAVFDARGRVTRERTWDADGRPQRDDEVFEDGSRKAYAR